MHPQNAPQNISGSQLDILLQVWAYIMLILKEKVFDKKSLLALKFRIFLLDHLVSVFLFFVCLEFAPIVMTPWIVNRVKFSRIDRKTSNQFFGNSKNCPNVEWPQIFWHGLIVERGLNSIEGKHYLWYLGACYVIETGNIYATQPAIVSSCKFGPALKKRVRYLRNICIEDAKELQTLIT